MGQGMMKTREAYETRDHAPTVGGMMLHVETSLSEAGIEDARLEAELLLAHVLETDRTHLFTLLRERVSSDALGALVRLLDRRLAREPLAYLLGWRWFYGLLLAVRPGVLIPRQETETLVDEALRLARERFYGAPLVADVGCGSGAIAVAVAVNLPGARVYAIDNSAVALQVTRENCERLRVQDQVTVLEGDLLAPLPEPVDMVAANLPYIPSGAFPTLQPEVQHEPCEALDGGPDGLRVIVRLVEQWFWHARPKAVFLVECDPGQMRSLRREVRLRYPDASLTVVKDLAGRDRVFEALL